MLQGQVPTLTSYDGQNGRCVYTSEDPGASCYIWKVFDKDFTTYGLCDRSNSFVDQYIGYCFNVPIKILKARIVQDDSANTQLFCTGGYIVHSDDGENWAKDSDFISFSTTSKNDISISISTSVASHKYWAFMGTDWKDVSGTRCNLGLIELQFYGRQQK